VQLRAAIADTLESVPPRVEPVRGHFWHVGYGASLDEIGRLLDLAPTFRGVLLDVFWGDVEQAWGVFDPTPITSVLELCASRERYLWLWPRTSAYNVAAPPANLGPAGVETYMRTTASAAIALYDQRTAAAHAAFYRYLGDTIGDSPWLAYVDSSCESAPGSLFPLEQRDAQLAGLVLGYAAQASAFPRTCVTANINAFAGRESKLLDRARALGLGFSATDAFQTPITNSAEKIAALPRPRIMQASLGAIDRAGIGGALAWGQVCDVDALAWIPWHKSEAASVEQIIALTLANPIA
jgi:hypothetical protein